MSLAKKILGKRDDDAPEIEFGKEYRDVITGFEGKAIAYAQYITGCDQVGLAPGVDKEGKPRPAEFFDITRVEEAATGELVQTDQKPGGPSTGEQAPIR